MDVGSDDDDNIGSEDEHLFVVVPLWYVEALK